MTDPAAIGMKTRLQTDFDAAVERVSNLLKEEGFGILTQIDMQGTLKQKLGAEIDRYLILGACNPNLAYEAIGAAPDIGLLLPCNVIVYEDREPKGVVVSIIDPIAMVNTVGEPALEAVGKAAHERLTRVIDRLRGAGA